MQCKLFYYFCLILLLINCSKKQNNPPATSLKPTGLSYGYEDFSYVFASSATDLDQDSIAIRFSWGDGDTSSWSAYNPSGDTISISHS